MPEGSNRENEGKGLRPRGSEARGPIRNGEPDGGDPGYRLLFDAVDDGMLLADAEERITDANPAVCRLLGRAREDLVGSSLDDIFAPSYPFLKAAREGFGGGLGVEIFKGTPSLLRGDGTSFPAEVSLLGERDGGKWGVVFRDVTERREAEIRYRTLVEQIPAVTYVQEVERNTLAYVSPQLEEVMGYSPEEYLADPDLRAKTIHPDDREWILAEDQRTDRTGEPYAVEHRRIRRDGRVIWVRDEAVLVRGLSERLPSYATRSALLNVVVESLDRQPWVVPSSKS